MCLNHTQITTTNMRGKFFAEHYIVSLQIRGMITWAGLGYPYPIPLNSLGVGLNSHPTSHLPRRPSPRMSCTHGRAPFLRPLRCFGIGVGVHIPTAREVVASGSAVVTRCMLPFKGHAHYDHVLDVWVRLHIHSTCYDESNADGYLCACRVMSGWETPKWKVGEEKFYWKHNICNNLTHQ
jgi:hypothetical protein